MLRDFQILNRFFFSIELLEFSEDRHPWESVEEKLDAIRYGLLVSSIPPFFQPPFLPLFVPAPLLLSLLLSLRTPSPFSLPSQLLSLSLYLFLLDLHFLSSTGRYVTTLVSFFGPAIFRSVPELLPSVPLLFRPFLHRSFPSSFSPPFLTHSLGFSR